MKTIHKYALQPKGRQKITMPVGSQLLTAQVQQLSEGQYVCLWAIVETDNEPEQRNFLIVGAGQPIKHKLIRYISTVQLTELKGAPEKAKKDIFVAHVFEVE